MILSNYRFILGMFWMIATEEPLLITIVEGMRVLHASFNVV